MKYAIIAGTGFENYISWSTEEIVKTPYGDCILYSICSDNLTYYYIPRHGINHSVAPHLIDYRSYIWALKKYKVDFIFSLCAVGSCREDIEPGNLVIINDILDRTHGRNSTYFDGEDHPLKHLEVSNLYNSFMCELLKERFSIYRDYVIKEGIYVCTQGPRFETAIEIKEYKELGCSVVGMTNAPEVFLAAELGIHYSALALVTNYCTGVIEKPVTLSVNFQSVSKDIISVLETIMKSSITLESLGSYSKFI